MSQTIHKFQIEITDEQTIDVDPHVDFLSVQAQRGTLCLWGIVNPEAKKSKRRIYVIGTGHPLPEKVEYGYIGTVQTHQDQLVWHVFDGGNI